MRNIKILIPLLALLILIPSILALDEGISFGDSVTITVIRAPHNHINVTCELNIKVNDNLQITQDEAEVISPTIFTPASSSVSSPSKDKPDYSSYFILALLIGVAYFLFFTEHKVNLKLILIILAFTVAYIILINIVAELSIIAPTSNETKISGEEVIGVNAIVQVTVNRQRWWGNIVEENGDSKAYIFKIIPLPLKYDNISFIKFHVIFLIATIIFFYLKTRKKTENINQEVNQNNESPPPNLQTFEIEHTDYQDINKYKDISSNQM